MDIANKCISAAIALQISAGLTTTIIFLFLVIADQSTKAGIL